MVPEALFCCPYVVVAVLMKFVTDASFECDVLSALPTAYRPEWLSHEWAARGACSRPGAYGNPQAWRSGEKKV